MIKRKKFKVKRNWIINFIKDNFQIFDSFEIEGEKYIVFLINDFGNIYNIFFLFFGMDDRPDLGVPQQSPLQQTPQASNVPQKPVANPVNTQQQAAAVPDKKKMSWGLWAVIIISVLVIVGGGIYYFFFR